MVRRAITLGGGGPAAGLHIGVLEALHAADITPRITFDVWALSCIGAWVGIVYNQFDGPDKANQTHQFFKEHVFRDDESYARFPINSVFGADWFGNTKALMKFVSDIRNYEDVWLPHRMMSAFAETMSMFSNPNWKWNEGDINGWILNQVLAPNPFVRNLASMMYLSGVKGLSKINYPESSFMKSIQFKKLFDEGMPSIFHNAWNLDEKKLALFSNHPMRNTTTYRYQGPIGPSTLCACSALPFIEGTVEIGGTTYCEGALVDTVNFNSLLEEHHDPNGKPKDRLDEIWVSRIVDSKQVRKPEDLHDALANLCQLFAATVGEDDVELFKYHVRCPQFNVGGKPWAGTVVEIHVPGHINFKWNHSNLDASRELGKAAAKQAIEAYRNYKASSKASAPGPHFINENPGQDPSWRQLCAYHEQLKKTAG
jgi:predicted acylesterase/phospholipase RssA